MNLLMFLYYILINSNYTFSTYTLILIICLSFEEISFVILWHPFYLLWTNLEVRCQQSLKEYRVNDLIEKQCPDGSNLYKVKCTSQGKWSLPSHCLLSGTFCSPHQKIVIDLINFQINIIDCGLYPFFTNTKLIPRKNNATYQCINGYRYKGINTLQRTITCSENGWQTMDFSCEGNQLKISEKSWKRFLSYLRNNKYFFFFLKGIYVQILQILTKLHWIVILRPLGK